VSWLDAQRHVFVHGPRADVAGADRMTVWWAWSIEDAARAASFFKRPVRSLKQEWERLGRPQIPHGQPQDAAEVRLNAQWMEMEAGGIV